MTTKTKTDVPVWPWIDGADNMDGPCPDELFAFVREQLAQANAAFAEWESDRNDVTFSYAAGMLKAMNRIKHHLDPQNWIYRKD